MPLDTSYSGAHRTLGGLGGKCTRAMVDKTNTRTGSLLGNDQKGSNFGNQRTDSIFFYLETVGW